MRLLYKMLLHAESGLHGMLLFVVTASFVEAGEVPHIIEHPQSAVIRVQSKASLHCQVTGNTTSIYWLYKDRRITPDTENIRISGGHLVIESFHNSSTQQPGSEGIYRCVASNDIGTVLSLPARLEAAYIGDFYEDRQDVYSNITLGNVALIRCPPVSGRPRPRVYFELNGTRLDTAKDGYYVLPSEGLQIANVTPRHSGLYRCIAHNEISGETKRAEHLVHLNVITPMIDHPPVFHLVPPLEVKVIEGDNVTLGCVVGGAPVPVVTWSKYGGRLPSGRYRQVFGNLELYDIGRLDEGTYICTAHNNVGPRQVAIAELNVQEPPSMQIAPTNQLATMATSVDFKCQGRGKPTPVADWYHDGRKLRSGKGLIIINDTTLTIRRVNTKHAGIYQCILTNDFGAVSGAAELYIVPSHHVDADRSKRQREQNEKMQGIAPDVDPVHPFIVTLPQNTTIYEGGATILPCGTRGQRVQYGENFLWLRNSATIEHVVIDHNKAIGQTTLRRAPQSANQRSELRVLESGSLQIINAQLIDSGEYTCVLWIDGSSDSASAYLTVKALGDQQQHAEHKNQSPDGATQGLVDREHGATDKSDDIITIRDDDPRETELIPPTRPSVIKVSDTSVMLEWRVPNNNGLPVTFFKVQYKELIADKQRRRWRTIDEDIPSHVRQFEVMELKPGSTYRFRIVAVYSNNDNKHGPNSRKFTMTSSADVSPRIPLDEPVIVEAKPLSENKIALKWQYIPEEWTPFDGFTIYYQTYGSHDEPQVITVHGSHIRETEINQLLPNTVYTIRMKSFNRGGESQFSNTVVKGTLASSDTDNYDHGNGHSRITDWPILLPEHSSTVPPSNDDFDVARNTEESNKMLYIILGCVLGILVIFLLFCMAMCAWKQQQRAHVFGERNKFQDQSRAIYTEENMRQKQVNGNGLLLNGLNGLTVPSNNLTNGHTAPFNCHHMNITSNPLTDHQRSSSAHLNYTSNSNNTQYEQNSGEQSPMSGVYDPSRSPRQHCYRDQPDAHMVTFGCSPGRQQNHVTTSDHLYSQPPEYPSIGSQKSRDHNRMPSPQVSVHSQSSSSYRVHDPYMTDHIPRSHERPQHQQTANKTTSMQAQRLAQYHVSPKHLHQSPASDDNYDSMVDHSDGNSRLSEAILTEQSEASHDLCNDDDSYSESAEFIDGDVGDGDNDDDGDDGGGSSDGFITKSSSRYHHVDTKSDNPADDVDDDDDDDIDDDDDDVVDCQSATDVPSSVPHMTQVPRLHDYPASDPED